LSKSDHPVIAGIRDQRTFAMIKPDGVMRGLIGEIILRLEKAGLKIVAAKMVTPTRQQVIDHYPMSDQAWVDRLGDKGLGTFKELELDPKEHLGTDDRSVVGRSVADSLIGYMSSGPVLCMVIEGLQSIEMVRKLAGHTLPAKAAVGTIRGDFSIDTPAIANVEGRALHNLLHASENAEEAKNEISLWFTAEEINSYKRVAEDLMFTKTY
jgi:nucleoside-diphosphate kinase